MTKYDKSIPVTGTITTTDTEDSYATHIAELGKGGYRVVETLADRDVISSDRRTEGMLVYVLADSAMYQLIDGVDNVNWVQPNFDTLSDLTENYIFVGNAQGKAEESTALIEVNDRLDELQGSTPLLKESSNAFPAAQVISDMQTGFLFHANAGNLISLAVLTNDHLPSLTEGHIRIGNASNRPHQILYELNTIPVNGDVDLNGFKATNSAAPANGSDLANKDYVDSSIGSISSLGQTTLTGAVTGSGTDTINTTLTPINTSQISNFNTAVTAFRLDQFAVPVSLISMNGQRITATQDPVDPQDVVTKNYVDSLITDPPVAYMGVYNYNDNLNVGSGPGRLTYDLPFTLSNASRGFEKTQSGALRALASAGNHNYIVRITMQIRNLIGDLDLSAEIVKNETYSIVNPKFTTRLIEGEFQIFTIESEPVFLRGGIDTLGLALDSSVITGTLNPRNISFYVTKL